MNVKTERQLRFEETAYYEDGEKIKNITKHLNNKYKTKYAC